MNLRGRYRLADGVAIRPERFGGLAYAYQSRRLYFLHSHELAKFVCELTAEKPLDETIEAFCQVEGLSAGADKALLRALDALERTGIVVAAPAEAMSLEA